MIKSTNYRNFITIKKTKNIENADKINILEILTGIMISDTNFCMKILYLLLIRY